MHSSLKRPLVLVSVLASLAAASLVGAGSAQAQSTAVADAVIRAAHFSPTTPGVDVYLSPFSGAPSKKVWLTNVAYGTVSQYQRLTPAVYTVAMRPAGADPGTVPVLTWTLDARPGGAYTVAGVGADASVRGVVIRDDLTAPPSGQGRVRVIQAASRAPVVTVSATAGPVIARDAQFATATNYADVPAGNWSVRAVSTTSPAVQVTSPVAVKSGQITSVLLLDAKSAGITLRTVLDSSSSGVQPVGAVPAGAGGTAQHVINSGRSWTSIALAGLGLLVAASLLVAAGLLLAPGRLAPGRLAPGRRSPGRRSGSGRPLADRGRHAAA